MRIPTHEADVYLEVRDSLNDFQIVREIWCEDVYRVKPYLTDKTKLIMDLGACFGAFSRMCEKYSPDAKVYAVEPESHNIAMLKTNTKAKIIETAVSDYNGEAQFSNDGGNSKFAEGSTVSVYTFNALWSMLKLNQLDVLKIDVEGSELSILSAIDNHILENIDYITMEFHDNLGGLINILSKTHSLTTLGNKEGYIYGKRY